MHEEAGKDSASADADEIYWRSGTLVMTRGGFFGRRVNYKHSDFSALRVRRRPLDIGGLLICGAGLLLVFSAFIGDPKGFEFDVYGVLAVGFAAGLMGSLHGLMNSGQLVAELIDGTSVALADINRADESEVLSAFERFRTGTKA